MTFILTDTSDESQRYQFTLGEEVTVTTSTYELYDLVTANSAEQLIIIGPNVKMETARVVAEHFRVVRPSLGVILVRSRLDVTTMGEALRSGIREVVSSDDAAALVAASKRSISVSAQLVEANKVTGSVLARSKSPFISRNHNRTNRIVGIQHQQSIPNLPHQLQIQCIQFLGTIQLNLRDKRRHLGIDQNKFIRHCAKLIFSHRSSRGDSSTKRFLSLLHVGR